MSNYQLPIVDIDNPPRTLSKISEERKQRGRTALSNSIKKSNELWNKKTKYSSNIKDTKR